MVEPAADGGMDLLDPLFERLLRLDATEVARLDAGEREALSTLDTHLLRSNPAADAMRRAGWYARLRPEPVRPDAGGGSAAEHAVRDACDAAAGLAWADPWRVPERWRRFVEEGRACAGRQRLDGCVPTALIHDALPEAEQSPLTSVSVAVVSAHRCRVDAASPPALAAIHALLDHPATRRAVGLALGRSLRAGPLHLNLWRLLPGERMAVHPDGARYAATVVVGLNTSWNAEDGGAIAFGEPGPDGLAVRSRWLPHAGDALVFAPGPATWHAVEPPTRTRWTLSGWWCWPPGAA